MSVASYAVLFQLAFNVGLACVLCPLRLPPRPRPIDHFLLPSIENLELPESVAELCNATKQLPISGSCRNKISNIVCALSDFIEAQTTTCNVSDETAVCAECFRHKSRQTKQNFWAIAWLDSLGKMPSAINEGNYYWFGDYEQCLGLKTSGAFDGKYCQVLLEVPDAAVHPKCRQSDPLEIHLGVCAPTECSVEELGPFLQSYSQYQLNVQCEAPPQWPLSSQLFMSFLAIWITIIFAGTLLDISDRSSLLPDHLTKLGRCVSIPVNGSHCLSTKRFHEYHSIQGLQVLSTFLIVTANGYLIIMPYIENVLFSYQNVKRLLPHPLNNFSFHIDALIATNSLFASLSLNKILTSTDEIKKQYLKRLIQVVPGYGFLVLFMKFIFGRLSSGPMWNHDELVERCNRYWWQNLLFINNLFTVKQTCLDGGYILSLEAQFFVILAVMVYLSLRYPRAVQAIAALAILVSVVYTYKTVITNALPPSVVLTVDPLPSDKMAMFIDSIYIKPWTRAPAFLIGFLFSFLFTTRNKLGQVASLSLRFLATVIAVFAAYSLYPYVNQVPSSRSFLAFYAAIHRPLWSFAICLVVYLCYRRSAGEMRYFLEWRIFAPLAKQSYMVILVSEPIFIYLLSSLHRPFHATHLSTLYVALGTIVLSYFIAFIFDIFVSRPVRKTIFFEMGLSSCYQKADDGRQRTELETRLIEEVPAKSSETCS